MAIEVKLPSLGENIESGDVLTVLVREGDLLQPEQGIVELETDKATVEVPCPTAGRVQKVHVHEGDTVAVGGLLVTLEPVASQEEGPSPAAPQHTESMSAAPGAAAEKGTRETQKRQTTSRTQRMPAREIGDEPPAEAPKGRSSKQTQDAAAAAKRPSTSPSRRPTASRKDAAEVGGEESAAGRRSDSETDVPGDGRSATAAGPAVRRLARELGVDLRRVRPSGPKGRITTEDVQAYVREAGRKAADRTVTAAETPPPGLPGTDDYGPVRREKMSRMRQTIARNMVESYTRIPQLTNFDDADVTELEKIRQESKADYQQSGIRLTSLPFLVRAVAAALKRHAVLNASIDEESQQIIYKEYIHIGIAVDTPRGLAVPVVRDVDQMNIAQIARELDELARKVREGSHSMEELRGGTFTVSNLGAIGGTYSTPIINPPEVAILLVGRSRRLPVVVGNQIEIRLMMPLSLTYDHRVVDGAAAARFVNELKGYLEAPGRLLLAP
jgi:pyruvate dehydrogenase E2 component (dihydrolipoamide acetyltransferase)